MEVLHHGISLKVTDTSSHHVPTSNLGIKAAGPNAQKTHDEHRRAILKKYPKLSNHSKKNNEFNKFINKYREKHTYDILKDSDSLNYSDSLNLSFLKLLNKTENKSALEDGFESSNGNLLLKKTENKSAFERSRSNWNHREYIQQLATIEPPKPKIPVANPDLGKTRGKYGLSESFYKRVSH